MSYINNYGGYWVDENTWTHNPATKYAYALRNFLIALGIPAAYKLQCNTIAYNFHKDNQ